MLMLTHTWILRKFLGSGLSESIEPDLYLYNVSPDMLPIHSDITPDMTHGISRFRRPPKEHRKAAFVQFHLLVDDIAHYGTICQKGRIDFDPHSNGYAYRKGRLLIEPLIDFHKSIGSKISYNQAAYRAHIIVEMAFDQIIHDRAAANREFNLPFPDVLNYTVENRLQEFCRTTSWLYGIHEQTIAAALKQAIERSNRDSAASSFASFSSRIGLYIGKFGLDRNDEATCCGLEKLMHCGMDMVSDYDDFLATLLITIRESGFAGFL
jgi:hypothetical protein